MIAIQASGGSQVEARRPTPGIVSDGRGCLVRVRGAAARLRGGSSPRNSR